MRADNDARKNVNIRLSSKRKRAFRRALRFLDRRAASFGCFLVRRFVVLSFLRFVVRCVVLLPFVCMRRPVVLSFVVSVFGRFVVGVLSFRCFVVRCVMVLSFQPHGGPPFVPVVNPDQ